MVFSVAFVYFNSLKAAASSERTTTDACHAIRNGNARQATATQERILADACHAIRDGDVLKANAIIERPIADACYTSIGRNNTIFAP